MAASRLGLFILCLVIVMVGFAIGFLTGFFAGKKKGESSHPLNALTEDGDYTISEKLMEEINAENIRSYLKDLTSRPHLAGTPADLDQAEKLKEFWEQQGLSSVKITPFSVLLSYPDADNPNRIRLLNGDGVGIFRSQLAEKILRPEQDQPDVVPPFNAYSGTGEPKGDLIYVNYGRIEDFRWLQERGVNFTGLICIARYGKVFRGDKAKQAELFGASGLILYSDPADYAVSGMDSVYPESWWLPASGVQRGSILLTGDPLTPDYPATESAYRLKQEEANLPKIPVHPIGYGDAKRFLQYLGGDEVPVDWQGGLPITYRVGPGFKKAVWKVQMHISTHSELRTTYNVHGVIEGEVEPDRYVLLGNHRDAWVFGAVDPSSGTASMMEVSRAMGALVKKGWRPRRSLVFCSWGAEEQGLIGSTEWVEYYQKLLGNRAVAYLNVDIAVQGSFTFRGRGLPPLKNTMYEVAKRLKNPNPKEVARGRATVYDTWAIGMPDKDSDKPSVPLLGSGSDFLPFVSTVGVTGADLRYHYDETLGISSYPLYHSVYETFHLMNEIIDPTFAYHRSLSQFWAEMGRWIADSYILPFDITEFTDVIRTSIRVIRGQYDDLMLQHNMQTALGHLDEAVDTFDKAAASFMDRLKNADIENPLEIRQLNDQMMMISRAFINSQGLPGRPLMRNVAFAPSQHNTYSGVSFPGLLDTLYGLDDGSAQNDTHRREAVMEHLSVVTFIIEGAANTLNDPVGF